MAVMYWAMCITLLASSAVSSSSPQVENINVNDGSVGNWSVGNCILAKFAMNFTIYPEGGNGSTINLPTSAVADKDQNGTLCSTDVKNVQTLTLSWNENQKNDTEILLHRFVQIQFKRMENSSYYGISSISGEFDIATYGQNDTYEAQPDSYMSIVTFNSKNNGKLILKTPQNNSYSCLSMNISLPSSIRWNSTQVQQQDIKNTTILFEQLQFDAFRNDQQLNGKLLLNPPSQDKYRVPIDCNEDSLDMMPIIVGIAVACLFMTCIVAYILGRRHRRLAGYQSV